MDEAVIAVRVTPRSGKDEISGWQDGELRVRLRAAPIEGQANEGLRRLLARALRVPSSSVEIVSGATSRSKRVRITGLSVDEVRSKLL
jgi:uncharacterized protein (TIGR00251 family)